MTFGAGRISQSKTGAMAGRNLFYNRRSAGPSHDGFLGHTTGSILTQSVIDGPAPLTDPPPKRWLFPDHVQHDLAVYETYSMIE